MLQRISMKVRYRKAGTKILKVSLGVSPPKHDGHKHSAQSRLAFVWLIGVCKWDKVSSSHKS